MIEIDPSKRINISESINSLEKIGDISDYNRNITLDSFK